MTVSVQHASPSSPTRVSATARTHISQPRMQHLAVSTAAPAPGVNPQDFIAANRIHVKDGGSLFPSAYLTIHPRELAPEREAELRQKLALTYSLNSPSFFEPADRDAVARALGQLIPSSLEARRAGQMQGIARFNDAVDHPNATPAQQEITDKKAPFAATVRETTQHRAHDPLVMELLENSMAMSLLVREKLTKNGYPETITEYVSHNTTPDFVLADLAAKIGVAPLAMREAAAHGGLDAVGQLLGLDPGFVRDVKAVSAQAATQRFSYNLIEQWHIGRRLLGINAPLKDKIAAGSDAQITAAIQAYRNEVGHHYEVPDAIKAEERRIAEALKLVDPVQRELLYKLGYQICYSPDYFVDKIAFAKNDYGLNRKIVNDPRDVRGTYRLYFSGHGAGEQEASLRTLVHEIAHTFLPAEFSAEEQQKIDQLIASDGKRFAAFHALVQTQFPEFEKCFKHYQAAQNMQEKQAAIAITNKTFAGYGLQAEGLFPYLRDAHDFAFAVDHAYDVLRIDGERYLHGGYSSTPERLKEMISRFAELTQVKYRGEPQFLQFLAPGYNDLWENHFLPHIARVNQAIDTGALPAVHAPEPMHDTPIAAESPFDFSPGREGVTQTCGLNEAALGPGTEVTEMRIDPTRLAGESIASHAPAHG